MPRHLQASGQDTQLPSLRSPRDTVRRIPACRGTNCYVRTCGEHVTLLIWHPEVIHQDRKRAVGATYRKLLIRPTHSGKCRGVGHIGTPYAYGKVVRCTLTQFETPDVTPSHCQIHCACPTLYPSLSTLQVLKTVPFVPLPGYDGYGDLTLQELTPEVTPSQNAIRLRESPNRLI
jgi:hypothetical protein